jgi:cytosine deaminase
VTVAAGGDNLRDPFNPVGRADPCETAALMVACGHLDGPAALDTVTAAPRRALGLPPVGLVVGAPADLIALPAADALEALAAAPAARTVWRAGRIAARTTVTSEIAAPRPVPPASTSSVTAPTSTASAGTARPARPDRPERRPFQEVDS